ncbi:hypothetical protein B0H11DRAFT_1956774 [Mycena galericulata]|nr:hypothetical protein B0H11DRAFT_1956774 [Mycena galericulata]
MADSASVLPSRSGVAAYRARLSQIKAEIKNLERTLRALIEEREETEERFEAYKYPVLTLPSEVTAEIFTHFLPVYPLCPPSTAPRSPTRLTHICRPWREIALSTPWLWRGISLNFKSRGFPGGKNDLERKTELLESWLTRSCSFPLSIKLDVLEYFLPADKMTAALESHRARWEYIDLQIGLLIDTLLDGPMPFLRSLKVTDGHASCAIPIHAAPRLQEMALHGVETRALVNMPCGHLTSLVLEAISLTQCKAILERCVNLIHCNMTASGYDSVPRIKCASMKSFILGKSSKSVERVPYLYAFDLPALCTLHVAEEFLGEDPVSTLALFISRSGCKLRKVHISGDVSISEAVYRQSFPTIPRFCIEKKDESYMDYHLSDSYLDSTDDESDVEWDDEDSDTEIVEED